MQDYVCLMRKLLENGILTEKDSFALVNAEEAEHISLLFYGTLIITGAEDEERQKCIFIRLMKICDETTGKTSATYQGPTLWYQLFTRPKAESLTMCICSYPTIMSRMPI